jgi:hypothetical protein
MEIIEEEIEAAARMKSLANEPGERREFGYIQLRGAFHVGQTRYIESVYGMKPLARYRNKNGTRQQSAKALM